MLHVQLGGAFSAWLENSQFQLPYTNTGKHMTSGYLENTRQHLPLPPKIMGGIMLLRFGNGIMSDILGRKMLAPRGPGIPAADRNMRKIYTEILKENKL